MGAEEGSSQFEGGEVGQRVVEAADALLGEIVLEHLHLGAVAVAAVCHPVVARD